MSPWCYKRLERFGAISRQFRVAQIQPSKLRQIAIAKDRSPGTKTNQDSPRWSAKVDIRKLGNVRAERSRRLHLFRWLEPRQSGILEFVEMFKARSRCGTRC